MKYSDLPSVDLTLLREKLGTYLATPQSIPLVVKKRGQNLGVFISMEEFEEYLNLKNYFFNNASLHKSLAANLDEVEAQLNQIWHNKNRDTETNPDEIDNLTY